MLFKYQESTFVFMWLPPNCSALMLNGVSLFARIERPVALHLITDFLTKTFRKTEKLMIFNSLNFVQPTVKNFDKICELVTA